MRRTIPGATLAALWLGACVEPDASPDRHVSATPIPPVVDLVIDSGGQVALQPGAGIGVAVEYAEGGAWSVTTSCDTTLSGAVCDYDLLVSTDFDSPIAGFEGLGLEGYDELFAPDELALQAAFETAEDADGFGFTTSPGATVRVSALLYDPVYGWSDDPRVISWVGDGAVHRGAPTNPVDLTPDRP